MWEWVIQSNAQSFALYVPYLTPSFVYQTDKGVLENEDDNSDGIKSKLISHRHANQYAGRSEEGETCKRGQWKQEKATKIADE